MEKKQDLGLADGYLKPQEEYRAELNGEDMESANGGTRESKGSPNLLQMLKAAERRRTQQSRDRDRLEVFEVVARKPVTEALKTTMVSRDSAFTISIKVPGPHNITHAPVTLLHRERECASTQDVNDF